MNDIAQYELTGPPDAPLVVVLGGISASRHILATERDPSPGWWDAMVGPGRAIDTDCFRVLGVDYLDGGRGRDGRPARIVTTHDQADAIAAALTHLDVEQAHAVVGASYGGMVALAFGERYPHRAGHLAIVSAAHRAHPMSTALRSVQRGIVQLGLRTGTVCESLALARGLAMTTYRSAQEFAERFPSAPIAIDGGDARFPVESYLAYHGERFASTWRPERFLALSLSADLHRVDPECVVVPSLLVAAEGDTIVPVEQMRELARGLGAPARLVELPTTTGHDAFLTEPDALGTLLAETLAITIPS